MSPRDTGREQLYAAERMVFRMFDGADAARTVQIAGTSLTLPVEARFASADSVREHVGRVVAMGSVRERFPRASVPVSVRARRGHRAAQYRPGPAEIAIPHAGEGRWALRELVVLHELAHHLDDSGDAPHGRGFMTTLIDLVGLVLGPEAALVYRVLLSDAGVLR